MGTSSKTHSDQAVDLALASIGCASPRTALIVLFFGVARRLGESLGDEMAADLAYQAADELATGGGS